MHDFAEDSRINIYLRTMPVVLFQITDRQYHAILMKISHNLAIILYMGLLLERTLRHLFILCYLTKQQLFTSTDAMCQK